MLKTPEY